mgnify:CR=1 FL=1
MLTCDLILLMTVSLYFSCVHTPLHYLRLLDEACKKPNATDKQLCESLAVIDKETATEKETKASQACPPAAPRLARSAR